MKYFTKNSYGDVDSKVIATIDQILPYLPSYGEFDFFERMKHIKSNEMPEFADYPTGTQHIPAPEYLVENGFALNRIIYSEDLEFLTKIFYQLTDKGRDLRNCGSLRAFFIQQEEKEKNLKRKQQIEKYTYRIQVSIAIATGIAAIYYAIEITKSIQKIID